VPDGGVVVVLGGVMAGGGTVAGGEVVGGAVDDVELGASLPPPSQAASINVQSVSSVRR
jgi:hypothetical protein